MNFWILKGRTPEKCGIFDRVLLMVKTGQFNFLLKEDTLNARNGEIKICTVLLALTLGEDPVFETMARGPGTPLDLVLKPFESKAYASALLQHEKLVQKIKSEI
jgi:hypothetical protein